MYKRNEVILNERAFVEEVIKTGDLGKKPSMSINLAARLYRGEGLTDDEIRAMLEQLILRHDPNTSVVKWDDIISRAVRTSEKYSLVEIDSVPITKLELDICDSLGSKQKSRVMFVLFCMAKFEHFVNDKNHGWVDIAIPTLFKMANVATDVRRQSIIINELYEDGYIRLARNVDSTSMQVVFMDLDSMPVMFIDNFRDLGNQYMQHCGIPYFRCAICGALVRRKTGTQVYCTRCSKPVNRKKTKKFVS